MGRYDGEDYSETSYPHKHQFQMNGDCFICHRSRTEVYGDARSELERAGYKVIPPGELGHHD